MIFFKISNYFFKLQIFIIVSLSLFLSSCSSSVQVLKPRGDSAQIIMINNSKYNGELLSVKDRSIILLHENKITEFPLSEIDKVHIEGYSLLQKKSLVLGTLSIMDIFFLYSSPTTTMKVIYGMLAIGKLTTILGGDPEVVFTTPLFWKDLDKVRLHCRFPQGLEPEQWDQLFQFYGQSEF